MHLSRYLVLPLLLLACDKPVPGDACEVTGDGFTRKDPCTYMCVDWEVPCRDGTTATPDVCSGAVCEEDADCSVGFACAATHADKGACLPVDTCASGFSPGRWVE